MKLIVVEMISAQCLFSTFQVLRETDLGLQLVTLKGESIKSNLDKVRAFILSPRFYNVVMVVVVLNSVINALGTAPGVEMPILDRDSVVFPIEVSRLVYSMKVICVWYQFEHCAPGVHSYFTVTSTLMYVVYNIPVGTAL